MNLRVERSTLAAAEHAASLASPAVVRMNSWMQRVGGLAAIPGLLRGFGVDPVAVLGDLGLARDALDHAENRIPFVDVFPLVNDCVRRSHCAHFGLLAGQAWRVSSLGLIGQLMRQAPTIGDALRTHVVNETLNNQGIASYLFEYPVTAQFGFTIFHPDVDQTAAVYDLATAAVVSTMRELHGGVWQPTQVLLPRARPADETPYRRFFACEVKYDADRAAVRFPRGVLERPLAIGVSERPPDIERDAIGGYDRQLLLLLYRSLRLTMLEGPPSLTSLARQFNMHERTLNRRLRLQGTSFKQMLDDVRYEAARELLRDTRRSVGDISAALGYSEDTVFVRAFRRWSGTTPGEWRTANSPLERGREPARPCTPTLTSSNTRRT